MENRQSLTRKRHDMDLFHLHPLRRNTPFRCLKIDFPPFRADQLIAPDEHQWRKAQGAGDEKVPLIGVNVT